MIRDRGAVNVWLKKRRRNSEESRKRMVRFVKIEWIWFIGAASNFGFILRGFAKFRSMFVISAVSIPNNLWFFDVWFVEMNFIVSFFLTNIFVYFILFKFWALFDELSLVFFFALERWGFRKETNNIKLVVYIQSKETKNERHTHTSWYLWSTELKASADTRIPSIPMHQINLISNNNTNNSNNEIERETVCIYVRRA